MKMSRSVIKEKCIIDFDVYTDGSKYQTVSAADEMVIKERLKQALQDYLGHRNMVLDLDFVVEGKHKQKGL